MSRRIVVCWPEPAGLRHDFGTQQLGFLLMSAWCAERRLYPGPGQVARLAGPKGLQAAACALHVPSWSLVVACNKTPHGWAVPLLAVSADVRELNALGVSVSLPSATWENRGPTKERNAAGFGPDGVPDGMEPRRMSKIVTRPRPVVSGSR